MNSSPPKLSKQAKRRANAPDVRSSVCAYCRIRRAVNRDHVVPKALSKTHVFKYAYLPDRLKRTVPACFECKMRKASRRLVPPSWAGYVDALNDEFGGTPWR